MSLSWPRWVARQSGLALQDLQPRTVVVSYRTCRRFPDRPVERNQTVPRAGSRWPLGPPQLLQGPVPLFDVAYDAGGGVVRWVVPVPVPRPRHDVVGVAAKEPVHGVRCSSFVVGVVRQHRRIEPGHEHQERHRNNELSAVSALEVVKPRGLSGSRFIGGPSGARPWRGSGCRLGPRRYAPPKGEKRWSGGRLGLHQTYL
jgi:hypothetical protein